MGRAIKESNQSFSFGYFCKWHLGKAFHVPSSALCQIKALAEVRPKVDETPCLVPRDKAASWVHPRDGAGGFWLHVPCFVESQGLVCGTRLTAMRPALLPATGSVGGSRENMV